MTRKTDSSLQFYVEGRGYHPNMIEFAEQYGIDLSDNPGWDDARFTSPELSGIPPYNPYENTIEASRDFCVEHQIPYKHRMTKSQFAGAIWLERFNRQPLQWLQREYDRTWAMYPRLQLPPRSSEWDAEQLQEKIRNSGV